MFSHDQNEVIHSDNTQQSCVSSWACDSKGCDISTPITGGVKHDHWPKLCPSDLPTGKLLSFR